MQCHLLWLASVRFWNAGSESWAVLVCVTGFLIKRLRGCGGLGSVLFVESF